MRTMNTSNVWFPTFFDEIFANTMTPKATTVSPAVNVTESENGYTIEMAALGMGKEDINVQLDENEDLVIKMEKKAEATSEQQSAEAEAKKVPMRYLRHEFQMAKYEKTFILPEDVDKTQIAAHAENGVLIISLPRLVKKEEEKHIQQIMVG